MGTPAAGGLLVERLPANIFGCASRQQRQTLSQLGIGEPLRAHLVEGYWPGRGAAADVHRPRFRVPYPGAKLLAVVPGPPAALKAAVVRVGEMVREHRGTIHLAHRPSEVG